MLDCACCPWTFINHHKSKDKIALAASFFLHKEAVVRRGLIYVFSSCGTRTAFIVGVIYLVIDEADELKTVNALQLFVPR